MSRILSAVILAGFLGGSTFGDSAALPPGTGRFRITIDAASTEDPAALIRQLAAVSRGRVESYADAGDGGFVIVASEAAVRVLGSDSRVRKVERLDTSAAPDASRAAKRAVQPQRIASPAVIATGVATPWTTGTYVYDGSGNISSIGRTPQTIGQRFVYDAFGRLTSGIVGDQKQTYGYDRFGNIRTITRATVSGTPSNITVTGASTKALGANTQTNRLSESTIGGQPMNASATYDDEGRLIAWHQSGGSFTYDALGMIVTWSGAADGNGRRYIYTPNEERIATQVTSGTTELSSEWTLRDASGKVLRRLERYGSGASATWTWKQDYVYLNGSLLAAEVDTAAKTLHFFTDHLGTPRLITGNGGVQIGRHDYLPFGEEVTPTYQDGERLKFTAHERDESALDYMHARYYSSGAGRFLSVDPGKDWVPNQPQTWNLYAYARNNPLAFFDPDGLKARLYTFIGFTNPGPDSELPTAASIRSDITTRLGSRIVSEMIQMNPKASPADFRKGLSDAEGMSMFIGHAFTPGPGLMFDNAHSDWLQNVTNNNSVVLLGSCNSAGFAQQFGINPQSSGQAFVGFAGKVNSIVLAEMTTMVVTEMEKGKSVGDAVATVRAELKTRGVKPSDFRIVLVGDIKVKITDEELKTSAPK